MRTATFLVAAFALLGLASSQAICTPVLTCSPTLSAVIVPAPFYALNFSTDPRPADAVYGWSVTGANEAGCASSAFHQGVVQLTGASHDSTTLGPSINLTAPFTEANSVSTPLPEDVIFGTGTSAGSVVDGTAGWTVEVTFKAIAQTQWAKVYDFGAGNGGGHYDVVMGWNNQNDYMSWTADAALNGGGDIEGVINPVVYGQWYHAVMVWQELVNGNGNWYFYANGVITQGMANAYFPPATERASANLGRSDWPDQFFVGEIDTFNIYNYALTAQQAAALATNAQGGCAITVGVPAAAPVTPVPTAFFDASFTTDPRAAGMTANYGWEQQDADDATCGLNSQHQGLLVLAGEYVPNTVPGGYVNLSTATGPDSIGQVLPVIGGMSAGTDAAAGWSFEVTFKAEVVYAWSKLFDIAQPQNFTNPNQICRYDILFGWLGGSVDNQAQATDPQLQFVVCDDQGIQYSMNGWGPLQLGTWYHVLISIQQSSLDDTQAVYAGYINGVLMGGAGGHYPDAVVRQNADLGRSSWQDSYWGGLVDSFRIYNYALDSAQALSLATTALGSAGTQRCPPATTLSSVVPADALIYSLTFSTDPTAAAGGASDALYQWMSADPSDSAEDQKVHQGVIILDGSDFQAYGYGDPLGPYVNLSAPSGSASVGQVLPLIGTDTSGLWSQGSVGFSIEMSVKLRQQNTWAKLMDLGAARGAPAGACNGDIVIGWYQNSNQLEFETCTDFGSGAADNNRLYLTQTTIVGAWYHIMVTVQQTYSNEALAIGYINGQYVANVSIAYPYAEYRRDATLGRSDWNDSYMSGSRTHTMHATNRLFFLLYPVIP